MAGRRPTPTAAKQLAGNPGKRPLNKSEPRPVSGIPQPPTHLSGPAKTEWHRLGEELDRLGLISKIDMASFAGYCEQYALWIRAKGVIARKGLTYEVRGMFRKRPEVGIAADALKQMRQFAIEFGLTPASRSRVQADPKQQPLPGMENVPEQRDPSKPPLPTGPWTDESFFGGQRH